MRRPNLALVNPLLLVACASHPPAAAGDAERHHGHSGHGMPHRFEHAEDWAKRFDDPSRDAWQKPAEVVALLGLQPGMSVADLGAGTGYFLRHLSGAIGAGGRVFALDVEADMIRYMKARAEREQLANVEARQVPFDDPALAPGSVDRILIVDTWHHLGDRAAYSKKLAAALKPGGGVFVVDFTMETEKGPPTQHRLTPEQVIAELEAGGLVAKVVEESLPDQYVVAGTRPAL
ncbi:MAG: class I SAM-dependent methyltransferase [Deltaproteobacteria bacterium]|nr:class I SAM-dependent methyltransferase [Deltaproteobacteria bacterium]